MIRKPQTVKLTAEQIQAKKLDKIYDDALAKAEAIGNTMHKKVIPIVINDFTKKGEYVIGFMYRPDLVTQLRLSDRGQEFMTGFSQEEASKVLSSLLIVSESDKRINMETEEGELYWKGALMVLYEFMKGAIPVLKKKS